MKGKPRYAVSRTFSATERAQCARFRLLLMKLAILVAGVSSLMACVAVPGDPLPRPVGIGRADDGRIRFLGVLCSDERISGFTVADNKTGVPVWQMSRPGDMLQGGWITLGDSGGFGVVDIPFPAHLPENIDATVHLTNGARFGSAFVSDEVPRDIADTGRVLNLDRKQVTAEEFLEQVRDDYC
ncbi:hypothetical protein [Sphaerisporangium rhizosphaerae]|uniref:Uncharacterized protein n=1 Tax=Sphaerisporangium rhizosphaerae TaxID=2269375 RepID=A0ABW2NYW0_9ACTN